MAVLILQGPKSLVPKAPLSQSLNTLCIYRYFFKSFLLSKTQHGPKKYELAQNVYSSGTNDDKRESFDTKQGLYIFVFLALERETSHVVLGYNAAVCVCVSPVVKSICPSL